MSQQQQQQQQADQGMAHMNSMNMNVAWQNVPMSQHMVNQHHSAHHSPEPDMSGDAAHLMSMGMPDQMQQHMYAVQHPLPGHQLRPQHTVPHHQGPPMHHHQQGMHPQQHMHHNQHQAMMQQQANLMDVSVSSVSTAGNVSFNMGDEDSRNDNANHEMRNLLNENRHRSLDDIARELHQNDRGPNSERLRQVFAMLWLDRLCERSRSSVPRGRVYASYASRCANEVVTVLNPASFGKLVRILYPGLRTRRLGVRGESKYHYVNFALKEDSEQPGNDANTNGILKPLAPPRVTETKREGSAAPSVASNATAPHAGTRQNSTTRGTPPAPTRPVERRQQKLEHRSRSGRIVFEPGQDMRYVSDSAVQANKVEMPYSRNFPKFGTVSADVMSLPDMAPYLPAEFDADAQSTLVALYRTHCSTIIECVRFCREKSFWHQLSSFQGTLTVPVQRLLFHPKMAGWIEKCDTLLYQRLVQLLGFLLLQVLPKPVVECLSNIAGNLIPFLRKSFSSFPEHSVAAKIGPASIFSSLARQALRVNVTAHAAANMLSVAENRDVMYSDLIQSVEVGRIAELLPEAGVDDFIRVCQTKVRKTISPANVDAELDKGSVFGMLSNEPLPETSAPLDLWTQFLQGLPQDFPNASAQDLVTYTSAITSSLTRDITLSQGSSFGTWWVCKCWIDEYVMFLASTGGFMDRYNESESGNVVAPAIEQEVSSQTTVVDQRVKAPAVVDAPPTGKLAPASALDRTKYPSPLPPQVTAEATGGDDSGIGIRTPEEEYRYEFDQGEQAEMGAPQTQ